MLADYKEEKSKLAESGVLLNYEEEKPKLVDSVIVDNELLIHCIAVLCVYLYKQTVQWLASYANCR